MKFKESLSVIAFVVVSAAHANGHPACQNITFSDVGWTYITATTATTTVILDALGYDTEVRILSVPVTYTAMSEGDVDIFLGNLDADDGS